MGLLKRNKTSCSCVSDIPATVCNNTWSQNKCTGNVSSSSSKKNTKKESNCNVTVCTSGDVTVCTTGDITICSSGNIGAGTSSSCFFSNNELSERRRRRRRR